MREILFRGKTKALIEGGGCWVSGSLILATDFTAILEQNEDDLSYPYLDGEIGIVDGTVTMIIPETIGQYTGLEDKNGKQIFEGDVFVDTDNDCVGVVAWRNGGFCIEWYGRNGMMMPYEYDECAVDWGLFEVEPFSYVYIDELEVIGNIHDNPELLEEE